MKSYDYIVVGAGLFGAVAAEQLARIDKSVLIIERRDHIGGNCYSYDYEGTNINVHKYGGHVFHTSNREVWDYINKFTEFNRYQHRVLITHNNRVYTMPINLGTINAFYNINLKPDQVEAFISSKREGIQNPKNLEEKAISMIGKDLYEAFIKGYTMKQWGCDPKELPPSIVERLPVRTSYCDAYFDDVYEGIPVGGYTPIFERMLAGIPVELNVDFFRDREYWRSHCRTLIYTGPVDRYFNYCFERLNWRSLRFEIEKLGIDDFQGTVVMNYADIEIPYTRILEPKHFYREEAHTSQTTVIMREYPHMDDEEPYYPVDSESDKEKMLKYRALVEKEKNVVFGGRLAEYKYLDMDDVIESALLKCRQLT
ncbi:UDP-galactopyranose mutase [Chloroflexota bacterium]